MIYRQIKGNAMYSAVAWLRRFCLMLLILPMGVSAVSLDDYLWRNRLLILVAPDVADPAIEGVLETLKHHSYELADRHMLVIQLYENVQSVVDDRPITAQQSNRLRSDLGVGPAERLLLLIGKDGSVKRRAPLDTDVQEIFRQIDAMPMRREEIRTRPPSGEAWR
jgi:hypothetical protein